MLKWCFYAFIWARVCKWLVRVVRVPYLLARVLRGDPGECMVYCLAAHNFSMLEWFLYAFIWARGSSWLVRVVREGAVLAGQGSEGDTGECMVLCLAATNFYMFEWFLYAFMWARVCRWLIRVVMVQYLLARVMRVDTGDCMVNCLAVTCFMLDWFLWAFI